MVASRRVEMQNKLLMQLAETVAEARSMEELTRPILEMLETVTGFESVYLTTIDQEAGLQHILYARNSSRLRIPEGLAVPWQDTLCRRALEEGAPWADDVPGRWPDSGAAGALGLRSYVSTPVHSGEVLYGTLCAASASARPLTPEAQRLLAMFARLIGQQVEREALLARLRQANLELNAVALTDPLTGLANRRALLAELSRMLARARREGSHLHVVFVDLDGFKAINDRHGHEVGDAFLAAVAARLTAVLRGGDFAARYGGDEFVLLVAATDPEGAENVRARIAAASAGRYELGGVIIDYPGASVGIATAAPGEGPDALLARADDAMYGIKRARRP
jgi:diguanylate cyclase